MSYRYVLGHKLSSQDSTVCATCHVGNEIKSPKGPQYVIDVLMHLFVSLKNPAQPVKVSQGSTYSELLSVIEEMSREIRPTYAGSKSAMERLKRGIKQHSKHQHTRHFVQVAR